MPFWMRRIDLVEARRRFGVALDACPEPTPLRAEALLAASAIDLRAGATDSLYARAEESLDIAVALRDRRLEWRALQRLADVGVAWDDGRAALGWVERALDLAPGDGPPGAEGLGVYTLGAAHWLLGDADRAEECMAESFERFRRLDRDERLQSPLNIAELRWPGRGWSLGPRLVFEETLHPLLEICARAAAAHVLVNHAGIARMRGDLARARQLVEDAEGLVASEQRGLAAVLARRAWLELADDDVAASRAALGRALELRRTLGDRRGIGMALSGLGFVDTVGGELERAEAELADARDLFRRAGDRWGLASTLWRTADLETLRGRFDEADAALEEAVVVLGTTRRPRWLAHTALNRAEVALARGDLELAAKQFAEARELYTVSADHDGIAAVDARESLLAGR
jgi:tetratricopeptide (TPR) repeat protein